MQQSYPLHFLIGLACSLAITLLAFEHYWEEKAPIVWDVVALDDYEENQQLPPIPKQEVWSTKEKLVQELPEEKPTIEVLVEIIHEVTEEPIETEKIPLPEEEDLEKVFTIVEHSAEPVGGMPMFYKYIKKHLKYPREAYKNRIQGKVFLSFIVEKNGSLSNIKVIRGIGYGCDEEAVRVLKNSPNWKPGPSRRRPVRQRMVFPIEFSIDGKKLAPSPSSSPTPSPHSNCLGHNHAERRPKPYGGMASFYRYVKRNLNYPDQARKAKVEGKVYVSFHVDRSGRLANVNILKGIGHGCDEEAIRLIMEAKPWKPRYQAQAMCAEVMLPITFKLTKKHRKN